MRFGNGTQDDRASAGPGETAELTVNIGTGCQRLNGARFGCPRNRVLICSVEERRGC